MPGNFFDHLTDIPHQTRLLAKGAMLFDRDDAVRQFYRVDTGEIHLLRQQLDGNSFILQRAGPRAILAEASLMSARYHCAAIAIAPSRLTYWPKTLVRPLIANSSQAAVAYANYLAQEVRTARMRAEIASLNRVSNRLDAWLAWHDGVLPDKGTWHSIARDISVSPEALYRELARRRKAGSIPIRT